MTLDQFNAQSKEELTGIIKKCCGSQYWVDQMLESRPFRDIKDLHEKADQAWNLCNEKDVLEAFSHHPKIGDRDSIAKKFASTAEWAKDEQKSLNEAGSEVITQLAKANQEYLDKFGYIFIVFATGKTASEMLEILKSRLRNDATTELRIAKAEQHKITKLRLQKIFK